MIKALIFDFDGLIIETEEPIYRSWLELYQSLGVPLPFSTWADVIGVAAEGFDPFDNLEKQLGRSLDREQIVPRRQARELELITALPILPGVKDTLIDARGLGLKNGLASSSSCEWVTGHLRRLELIDYFDCIRGKDDVMLAKPDPELFLAVLDDLNIQPQQAIVFEDSPNGILAAKRAGLFCIAVPTPLTRQLPLDQADMQINSLADMPLRDLILEITPLLGSAGRSIS